MKKFILIGTLIGTMLFGGCGNESDRVSMPTKIVEQSIAAAPSAPGIRLIVPLARKITRDHIAYREILGNRVADYANNKLEVSAVRRLEKEDGDVSIQIEARVVDPDNNIYTNYPVVISASPNIQVWGNPLTYPYNGNRCYLTDKNGRISFNVYVRTHDLG